MKSFRPFLSASFLIASLAGLLVTLPAGERLYNGIELPDEWPPRYESWPRETPMVVPWIFQPPAVIPIDVGRQLLVDDFLVEATTLTRVFHQPEWHPATPVLKPETAWEIRKDTGFAAPFSDGVWFDPADGIYKMWYMGGTTVFFCYATSKDGVHWDRPALDQFRPEGSNILKIEPIQRDSSTVWMDLDETDPAMRYKMMYFRAGLISRVSADGLHWSDPVVTQASGDRTTFFRNPFRQVWVCGVRSSARDVGRCRYYGEFTDFTKKGWDNVRDLPRWTCADSRDRIRSEPYVDDQPDLYNLDATPYESLLLGLFTIHAKVKEGNRPKINYVTLGYSRDGFHWYRPDRKAFLNVSEDETAWNYGNVQSAGGGCLVVGDQLHFYCSGRNPRKETDDGSGAATGLAILRRDGFASMGAGQGGGILTTRPLRFEGSHLHVNAACDGGRLRVEVIDDNGAAIEPYSVENCEPVTADKTLIPVRWKGAGDLSPVAGKPVRFRFHLENGQLYSFWVSPDPSGSSQGYVAAGGPGFTGHRDTVGRTAYDRAADGGGK